MSTISLIASSLWLDLYGRYIIDRESPYTANEKARLPTRFVCCAAAVRGHRVGSSAKLESRTRRSIMFVLLIRCRHRMQGTNRSSVCRGRPTSETGQTRSFGDVASMSGLRESGHG